MIDPMVLIDALRNTGPYMQTIFTQGDCYKFHLFLKAIFPDAIPVVNADCDHVGSLIGGIAYDINGVVDWAYRPLYEEDLPTVEAWNFADNQWLQIGECPYCYEPIPV